MVSLNVYGLSVEVNATPDTPLPWVLRDHLCLTGTKFGCGIAHYEGIRAFSEVDQTEDLQAINPILLAFIKGSRRN